MPLCARQKACYAQKTNHGLLDALEVLDCLDTQLGRRVFVAHDACPRNREQPRVTMCRFVTHDACDCTDSEGRNESELKTK